MDLDQCRKDINNLDKSLLELLAQRRAISRKVIEDKLERGLDLRDPKREGEVLETLIKAGRELGLDAHFVTRVFHEIIADSVRSQESFLQTNLNPATEKLLCIAYQGVEGAYSYLAGEKFFRGQLDNCSFEGYKNFSDVVAAVENGQADYAILPIENTTAGSINAVYDLLLATKLSIVGEEVFPVQHCLLGIEKAPLSTIRRIYSHYQALAQCSDFLSRLKNCVQETYMDTAEAAKKISEDGDPEQAAIASEEAGRIYGLEVLKRNLANQRENYTRFVIIAPRPNQVDSRVPCKTSLVLSTGHHEGALLKALSILEHHKINLTKLESRPMQGSPFTYIFYLDFEGNASDPKIQEALVGLSGATNYLRILGTYPRERHDKTRPSIRSRVPEKTGAPEDAGDHEPSTPTPEEPTVARDPDGRSLTALSTKPAGTIIRIGETELGGSEYVVFAGPDCISSMDQIGAHARQVSECGAMILHGSCLETNDSPFKTRRINFELLEILATAGKEFGLPVMTEIESVLDVAQAAQEVDLMKIGPRNMQNFSLLEEAGKTGRPIVLTRGISATNDEFLEAAECVLVQGNQQVILCERGIRIDERNSRNTLDLGTVANIRRMTHLPVIIDPTRAIEHGNLVLPLASASKAFGAHGLVVDVRQNGNANPAADALTLGFEEFAKLMTGLYT
ncbi:MAG: prephenate dehydratase [Planctomycetota bacterium]|nr:prephenate dehydratase [Planctomycetota bacterium]MEE3053101.1 prephenate dehydratase [Planctomycetota bacterium]